MKGYTPFETFMMAVVIAPLLETLIFQYAVIETAKSKLNKYWTSLLSALLFASFHLYNVYYFLFAFVSGLLFAVLYNLENKIIKGILIVLSSHCLYNLIVYGLKA